jgi:hypothetical protein
VHPVIDACLEIAGTPGFDPAAVGSIDLAVNPLVVALTDRPSPTDRAAGDRQHAALGCGCAVAWGRRAGPGH